MDITHPAILQYAHDHAASEPELHQRLAAETRESVAHPEMLTGRVEGRLLKLLVQLTGARDVLESGTFTGYASLSMAEGLPDDGRLVTCDIDPVCTAVAKRYFDESPHGKKIDLRLGQALETIAGLERTFDMVFIDADKQNYPAYYEGVLPKVRSGGLILVDNVLWSGRVLSPAEETDLAIERLNRMIAEDDRVESVLLTVRDGIQLVRKR